MPLLSEIVALVNPANGSVGASPGGEVWALFDREIDEVAARESFFLEGPETVVSLNLPRSTLSGSDPLTSPAYRGFVQGAITLERISPTTLDVVTTLDTTGAGNLYRTRVRFAPSATLGANTLYRAYLIGDEDLLDTRRPGIRTRTVFDTLAGGGNTGSGIVEFRGGYDGIATSDTFNVSITSAGEHGEAEFNWYRSSAPAEVHGPVSSSAFETVLLEEGVSARFLIGTFAVGDTFSAVVRQPTTFEGNVVWSYTTGSASIATPATTTSTSVIGDVGAPLAPSAPLSILRVTPVNRAAHQSTGLNRFTLVLNKAIAAHTLTLPRVIVSAEPVLGLVDERFDTLSANALTAHIITASGTSLVVGFSGTLLQNNIVSLSLSRDVAATDGATLGSDYSTFFTTQYFPLYCSVREIRLKIGTLIKDVPDDTVYSAIWEASRQADQFTRLTVTSQEYYRFTRQQWVCCKASEILLVNVMSAGAGLRSKSLGGLEVTYNSDPRVNLALQSVQECIARHGAALAAGANNIAPPKSFVRGIDDSQYPVIGRGWSSDLESIGMPAANIRKLPTGGRRGYRAFTRFPRGSAS